MSKVRERRTQDGRASEKEKKKEENKMMLDLPSFCRPLQ